MKPTALFAAIALLAAPLARAEVDAPAVWKSKCKGCHGETGKGDTKQGKKEKVEDMTTEKWQSKHSDADMKDGITNGVKNTKMKAFKDKLSEAEIDALVKLVRTYKP